MTAVVSLKTAPSFFLLGRGKSPAKVKWTEQDKILFAAVYALEQEKCPHCGIPRWHGSTADGRVDIEVSFSICYGCQVKSEITDKVKLEPGEWAHVHAVPNAVEDGEDPDPLPSRREGYAKRAEPRRSLRGE